MATNEEPPEKDVKVKIKRVKTGKALNVSSIGFDKSTRTCQC